MLDQLQYPARKMPVALILATGVLVGTLDILSAFIDYYIATGKNPLMVLTYIASGFFGASAFTGGNGMMLTGLLFHYIIAYSFTVLFFWLYSMNSFFSANRVLTGIVYGILIWLMMNLVVVQLSNAPHSPVSAMKINKIVKSMLILIIMIGLPLSFIAYSYFSGKLKPKKAKRMLA